MKDNLMKKVYCIPAIKIRIPRHRCCICSVSDEPAYDDEPDETRVYSIYDYEGQLEEDL